MPVLMPRALSGIRAKPAESMEMMLSVTRLTAAPESENNSCVALCSMGCNPSGARQASSVNQFCVRFSPCWAASVSSGRIRVRCPACRTSSATISMINASSSTSTAVTPSPAAAHRRRRSLLCSSSTVGSAPSATHAPSKNGSTTGRA